MKKFLYTFLMLLVGITTASYAQQEASTVTDWNGSAKKLRMRPDSLITFSYKATANGILYIYASDQSVYDNVPVSIWGGWYHDGSYDPDSPLQEAGPYENGVGVYGWIKVFANDEIRFTLSTSKDATGTMAMLTLRSEFFGEEVKGDSWEEPIAMPEKTKVTLPVYKNYDSDYLKDLSYATFCRFVAPANGVASIVTGEYLIYYIEESKYGDVDTPLNYVSQDTKTDDHEFVVKKDSAYIVILPNSRPTSATFKMISTRLGENCKAPIELTDMPATLNLVRGNNFYNFDLTEIEDKRILEVDVAEGWKGSVTFFENCNYESDDLRPMDVTNSIQKGIYNLDPMYTGNNLIMNFNVSNVSSIAQAVTLTLREAAEGESFETAKKIGTGEHSFSGPIRDYWFVYTAEEDAEIHLTTTDTLKHVFYTRDGGNMKNEYNTYRVSQGQSMYICISTNTVETNTINLAVTPIVAGDYCDNPIIFNLGEDVIIKDRGDNIMNYRQFTAEKSGFATFETTSQNVIEYYWSIYFRTGCDSKTISYVRNDATNAEGKTTRSYRIPVAAGTSYLFEIMSFANEGEDVIFTTHFEEANEGDVCATAIAITQIGKTIELDNTPETTVWHRYTADRTGFYTTYAKLGRGSNLKVKVGDCDADEINGSDDSRYNNAYMAGYKVSKVYVEEGQTLYICTSINADPGNTDGTNYYITPTFAEARPGERFVDPIQAEPDVEYTLTTGTDGFDTWYTYTLPAGKETTFTICSTVKNYSGLSFYLDEKTSLSAYKEDYTQTSIINEEGITIGKSYLFAASDTERTIYIKAPIATATEPVVWSLTHKAEEIDDFIGGQLAVTLYLYPNPTDGLFYVNVPAATEGATVSVTTLSGTQLYSTALTEGLIAIDLRGQLAAGIYLVTVNSDKQASTSKLIVK